MSETQLPLGTPQTVWSNENSTPTADNVYTFVTYSYEGSGPYMSGDYLIKHDKETNLTRRKRLVYYKNYIKGIINSLLTPVFSEEAKRESNNKMFDAFLTNVDNRGTSIQDFSESIVKYTRLHGVCFTIMDNFSAEEIPGTESAAIKDRKYPYIYFKTADEVHHINTDKFDRIESISFCDGTYTPAGTNDPIKAYRFWDKMVSYRYYVVEGSVIKINESEVVHQLGVVPVIGTYLSSDSDVLPHPPAYDLCRMNYTIYNMDSEQRSLERLCAFPSLAIHTKSPILNIDIGTDSLLGYGQDITDGTANVPVWISPDSDILTVMNTLSNEVLQKLIESANVLGATAINAGNSTKSGVALSYEFLGQQFALKQTARIAETFEHMVAILFGVYISETIEYSVEYRDNYTPTQDEVEKKINIYERILDLDISEMVNGEVKKELITDVAEYYQWKEDKEKLKQSIATDSIL